MKKFETAFIQKGITPEIGRNQEGKSTVYACLIDSNWNYLPSFFVEDDEELKYFNPVYMVEVTHPVIFAGTPDELRNTIIEFAKKKLREVGALKTSETLAGTPDEFLYKI